MVSRVLGAAPTLADAVIDQLSSLADKAADEGVPMRPRTEAQAEALSAGVWRAIWPPERLRQREFFNFGMEVLLKLDLKVPYLAFPLMGLSSVIDAAKLHAWVPCVTSDSAPH